MIKVLIVDDEAIARINLSCLVNWEKEGFVICGEAEGGDEALKKASELKPDIIFTDMNMPGMNGVEFIKKVKKISTSIKIIVFSGYEDFEFVRQSLKEGVIDYFIKHKMDAEALLSILHTIKENIEKESKESQRISQIMMLAKSGESVKRKNILMNLLNGYLQEDHKVLWEKYGIYLDENKLIVAAARIDNYYNIKKKFAVQEFNVFAETLENILSNLCEEIGKISYVNLEGGKFVFIMSFSNEVSEVKINYETIANINNIENTVKRFLNITMSFGISSLCPSIAELPSHYTEACTLLEKGYYKGENYIVQKSELSKVDNSHRFEGLSVSDEKNIIACIRSLNNESVLKAIENVFKNLKAEKFSYDTVKIINIDLINLLQRTIKEFNLTFDRIYPFSANLYEDAIKFDSLDELMVWFKSLYNTLMEVLIKNSIHYNYSIVIKRAIEFILKNYDKNISLSDMSQYVNVSPQYLSKLFKEECGVNFVTYLNTIRIEQSKRMITEGCEIKSLTKKLGFNSYTYFFTVFKEITGMTPQKYEKLIMDNHQF